MDHRPERKPNESLAQYRARQQDSREIAAAAMAPADAFRFVQRGQQIGVRTPRDLGQHPKLVTPREHKPKAATKPTWPRTDDQKAQQRALIVLGKNRERDAAKRTKPKSAVAKRMDRPHRTAMMERGHAKLMRAFGGL